MVPTLADTVEEDAAGVDFRNPIRPDRGPTLRVAVQYVLRRTQQRQVVQLSRGGP